MDTRKWLRCNISPGQFSQEYAISAKDHKGGEFSLFVDASFTEHDCLEIADGVECSGRLLVTVLDEKQGLALIRLPGRTFENGSTVTVLVRQLEAVTPTHA